MLTIFKIQVNNLLKRIFCPYTSNCKLLAKTALFCGINKALLRIKTGTNVTSCTNNIYTSVKSRQINLKSKKVVTYFIVN
jgi:hypothetical protein